MAKCPACLKSALKVVIADREVLADDGAPLPYQDELMACDSCGERYYTHDQAMRSSRARAGALREYADLLTPDQIRSFREGLGLSQARLEQILGTGAKTVVRWEKGTVCQSRAADQLMRLLMLNPANLVALSGAGAVTVTPTALTSVVQTAIVAPSYFQTSVFFGAGISIGAVQGMTMIFDASMEVVNATLPGLAPDGGIAANADYAQAA